MYYKRMWLKLVFIMFFISGCSDVGFAAQVINMKHIMKIESNGNPKAHNKTANARGLYQITPICLKEYNNFHTKKYSPNDLWKAEVNSEIATWYLNVRIPQLLKHYKKDINEKNVIIAYNAGINAVVKGYLPAETKKYLAKYNKLKGA